jgi:hypothetical protein
MTSVVQRSANVEIARNSLWQLVDHAIVQFGPSAHLTPKRYLKKLPRRGCQRTAVVATSLGYAVARFSPGTPLLRALWN